MLVLEIRETGEHEVFCSAPFSQPTPPIPENSHTAVVEKYLILAYPLLEAKMLTQENKIQVLL